MNNPHLKIDVTLVVVCLGEGEQVPFGKEVYCGVAGDVNMRT